jgi:hypothetical protein
MNARSFVGRASSLAKKFIGLGVWVKVARPASCSAEINIPSAMPQLSCT